MIHPTPQKSPFPGVDQKFYYKYHKNYGHDTDGCIRLRNEVQDLIDSRKITNPENPKNQTPETTLYPNTATCHPHILMINIGFLEEQVLNSFVNVTPTIPTLETKDLSLNWQPTELKVNVLDIWSSDDEKEGRIDLWK